MVWLATSQVAAEEVSLAEALDATSLVWTADGDAIFSGSTLPEGIGGDAAVATLENGQTAQLQTVLPGPGVIDFWLNGTAPLADWSASLDGNPLDLSTGSWPYGFRVDGEGTHQLTIVCTSSQSQVVTAIVDGVVFVPDRPVSLAEALDHSEQTWTSTGTPSWTGRPQFSHDGSDAAWSGHLEPGETTALETVVQGPAEISFWWRRTGNSRTNGAFYVNGTNLRGTHTSNADFWKQISIVLGSGPHTLRWEAHQQAAPSQDSPARGLWIDEFKVSPLDSAILKSSVPLHTRREFAVRYPVPSRELMKGPTRSR